MRRKVSLYSVFGAVLASELARRKIEYYAEPRPKSEHNHSGCAHEARKTRHDAVNKEDTAEDGAKPCRLHAARQLIGTDHIGLGLAQTHGRQTGESPADMSESTITLPMSRLSTLPASSAPWGMVSNPE
ncbi:hypothetical protein SDC9_199849 [bioreactor metagenome]|uniref:Uncharacterized protein n=1 Tax=bioreactor metagenome TaxID=1076179 RepID=A0A645IY92_9ZZZZ